MGQYVEVTFPILLIPAIVTNPVKNYHGYCSNKLEVLADFDFLLEHSMFQ